MKFDRKTQGFTATFTLDTSIKAPSVLYKTVNYAESADLIPQVFINGEEKVFGDIFEFSKEGNYLEFTAKDAQLNGASVKLVIQPASASL